MKLDIKKDITLDKKSIVFSSLPDMGSVGGIVSSFLCNHLSTIHIANILSNEKPWVSYSDGIVKSIIDIYKIYYNEKYNMIILTGNSQPQESFELKKLCYTFLDYIKKISDIRLLYSAGGYLKTNLAGSPRVCGVVNNEKLKHILNDAGVEFVGNEITNITWFNGVILGTALEYEIDAIGLFGEIPESNLPQPLAAKSILHAFGNMEKIHLDTKSLDKEYENILESQYKEKETSKFGRRVK